GWAVAVRAAESPGATGAAGRVALLARIDGPVAAERRQRRARRGRGGRRATARVRATGARSHVDAPACRQAFGVFTTHLWPCPEGRQHWVRGGSLAGLLPPLDSTKDIMAISATRYGLTTSVIPAPRLSGTFHTRLAFTATVYESSPGALMPTRAVEHTYEGERNHVSAPKSPQKWGGAPE